MRLCNFCDLDQHKDKLGHLRVPIRQRAASPVAAEDDREPAVDSPAAQSSDRLSIDSVQSVESPVLDAPSSPRVESPHSQPSASDSAASQRPARRKRKRSEDKRSVSDSAKAAKRAKPGGKRPQGPLKQYALLEPVEADPRSSQQFGAGLKFVRANAVARPMDLVTRRGSPDDALVLIDCFTTGHVKPKYHVRVFDPRSREILRLTPNKLNPGNNGRASKECEQQARSAFAEHLRQGSLRQLPGSDADEDEDEEEDQGAEATTSESTPPPSPPLATAAANPSNRHVSRCVLVHDRACVLSSRAARPALEKPPRAPLQALDVNTGGARVSSSSKPRKRSGRTDGGEGKSSSKRAREPQQRSEQSAGAQAGAKHQQESVDDGDAQMVDAVDDTVDAAPPPPPPPPRPLPRATLPANSLIPHAANTSSATPL